MATLNDLIQRCEEASKSLILIHRKQEWPKNVNLRELAYPISITKIETNESEIPEHFEVHERVRSKYPMNRRYVKMLEKTLDIGKIKEVRYVIDTTPGDTEDWLYVLFEGGLQIVAVHLQIGKERPYITEMELSFEIKCESRSMSSLCFYIEETEVHVSSFEKNCSDGYLAWIKEKEKTLEDYIYTNTKKLRKLLGKILKLTEAHDGEKFTINILSKKDIKKDSKASQIDVSDLKKRLKEIKSISESLFDNELNPEKIFEVIGEPFLEVKS